MPFGATFWGTGWEAVKHPHTFPNPSLTADGNNTEWRQYTLESWVTSECIQGPLNGYSGDDPNSLNIGKFIAKRTSDSSIVLTVSVVEPYARGFSADPNLITVDLMSDSDEEFRRVSYYAPFSKLSSGGGPPDPKYTFWVRGSGAGTLYTYYLYHVQPIAFRGVVSEVVGALLRYAGYSAANVDQDSFDDAYDAELVVGPDVNNVPYVWVIPEQGETIMATIKRVLQHWSHILTYNKDGKIAIRPVDNLTTFFSALDDNSNVIGIKSKANKKLILNKALAMHGGGYVRHVDYPSAVTPHPRLTATYEPHLKSDYKQEFIDEYSDTNSIAKFGERQFGNRVRSTFSETEGTAYGVGRREGGGPLVPDIPRSISIFTEGNPIKVAHYPLVHRSEIKDLIMARFLSNEAQIRTFLEVTQDFMGLDYEVGSIVFVPSLDADYRCINQTIDFNLFRVKSTLVRNFPTEYSSASTDIWAYINLDDAPVGTTALTESSGTMTLEIDLTTTAGLDWFYQIYISKDGGPWEEFSTGWDSETATLNIQDSWSGNTAQVEVIIRAADDDGSGGLCVPTPWTRMPTAVQ